MNQHDIDRVCMDCRRQYSPCIQPGGRMPRGYKTCPVCRSKSTVTVNQYLKESVKKKLEGKFGKEFVKKHVEII